MDPGAPPDRTNARGAVLAAALMAAGQPVRKDDTPVVFEERLREYYMKTAPLIGYYHAKGMLRGIDGMASIDEVTGQIDAVLGALAPARQPAKANVG